MPDIARDMIDGVALPFDKREDGSLTFVHLNPWPSRILIGAAGLIPLMAPYELLWRQSAPFSLAMLPFWLLSIMALSIALPLILGAILGISGQTVIDLTGRELRTHAIDMGSLRWTRVYPLATIATIDVREKDFSKPVPATTSTRPSGTASGLCGYGRSHQKNGRFMSPRSSRKGSIPARRSRNGHDPNDRSIRRDRFGHGRWPAREPHQHDHA
jgi:hypothetical protein